MVCIRREECGECSNSLQSVCECTVRALSEKKYSHSISQINEQIVLYVASRVIASFLPRLLSSSPLSSSAAISSSTSSLPPSLQPLSVLPPLLSKQANPRSIPPADKAFTLYAALTWGMVMYVYRHRGERLQPGMVNSMSELSFVSGADEIGSASTATRLTLTIFIGSPHTEYIYRDSEAWNSLKTLLWHNT